MRLAKVGTSRTCHPEIVIHLRAEPHLRTGAKRPLEAQHHRRADAGSTVQDCGEGLTRNAQTLRDFANGQLLRQVLPENFARVCGIVHRAHACLIQAAEFLPSRRFSDYANMVMLGCS